MIIGIVLLHTPMYVSVADIDSGWFDLTKAFFQSAAFRCTAPVLTLISGYLLFNARLDTDTRVGAWLARMSKSSYFIFLAHAPLLMLT